jgi:hypothetical protein
MFNSRVEIEGDKSRWLQNRLIENIQFKEAWENTEENLALSEKFGIL